MLFPKLPLHKPKLSLAEKSIHNMNDVVLELSSKKEEKQKIFRNSRVLSGSKHQIRSLSSTSTKNQQLSRNSLMTRKLEFNEKENKEFLKINRNDAKPTNKISIRLSECLKIDQPEPNMINHAQSIENTQKIDIGKKTFSQSEEQCQTKTKQSNSFQSFSTTQNTLKIVQNSLHSFLDNSNKKIYQLNKQAEQQNNFSFLNNQPPKLAISKSQCPKRQSKRTIVYEKSKNLFRTASINYFELETSVFSINIIPQNKQISAKKRALIQSLSNDNDFEWKYEKFRQYAQKYSEYEVKLKQNFETLALLTQNVQLLKSRIIPCKQQTTLKQFIEIVKPTLTQKQQKAYQTKMIMLEWKKKFFSKIRKINDKIINSYSEKYQNILMKLQDNEEAAHKSLEMIKVGLKKETVIFQREDILDIKNTLQTITLNQKQIIDQVSLFQTNSEDYNEKLNLLEEQWSHAFDIFNFTLENCAKKCVTLSETIEKFYGKCSTAVFLTKGIQADKEKDLKLIQYDKCHVCRWNEKKLKKIIEQNSLAKEYISALKHLVTH